VPRQARHRRRADATPGAGDDRDLPAQLIHAANRM
jgi:hypothetical protein